MYRVNMHVFPISDRYNVTRWAFKLTTVPYKTLFIQCFPISERYNVTHWAFKRGNSCTQVTSNIPPLNSSPQTTLK